MTLVFHLFKTSFRQVRFWLIALWLVCFLQPWLSRLNLEPNLNEFLHIVALIAMALLVKMIVLRVIHANPLVSTTAWWLTRPLHRREVFGSQALLLAGCILLPLMIGQGFYWACAGLTVGQWCAAQLELALLALTVILLLAALASLTGSYAQFLGAAGACAGGFFVWVILLELLQADRMRTYQPGRMLSAVLVGQGVLLAAIAAAWLVQGLAGRRRVGFALLALGLLAWMPCQFFWPLNFFKTSAITNKAAQIQPLTDEDVANPALTNQVLWSHFKVTGIPSNQVAVVRNLNGSFEHGRGRVTLLNQGPSGPFFGGDYRFDIWRRSRDVLEFVKSSFPSGTLWLADWNTMGEEALPIQGAVPPSGTAGQLKVEVGLDIYAVEKLAEAPVERGSYRLEPGHRLAIVGTEDATGRWRLKFQETSFRQLLRPETFGHAGSRFHSDCLFVLHNPATGEAFAFNPMNGGRGGTSGLSQERRMEFAWDLPLDESVSAGGAAQVEQWLRQSRLVMFGLKHQGTAWRALTDTQYRFHQVRDLAVAKRRTTPVLTVVSEQPPVNGTLAERRAYVAALLDSLPDRTWSEDLVKPARQKLEQLGPGVVPILARRLALADATEQRVVKPVLQSLTRVEHLPELLEGLKESPAIAWLLLEKKWVAESQAALRPWVKQRKVVLPPSALLLAARGLDGTLSSDLAWHFAHCAGSHAALLEELRKVPGFDAPGAVTLAWKRARLGLCPTDGLALAAAGEGLPEALAIATAQFVEVPSSETRTNLGKQLASLTGYDGPPEELPAWLLRTVPKLKYDAGRKRYLGGP